MPCLFCNWKSVFLSLPHLFPHPLTPVPSGNHLFILCLCFCFVMLLVHLFCFSELTYKQNYIVVYLSLPDLFHLAHYLLGPSMLFQVARFHSFLWLNNIPLFYVYVHTQVCVVLHILFIHSSIDGHLGWFPYLNYCD